MWRRSGSIFLSVFMTAFLVGCAVAPSETPLAINPNPVENSVAILLYFGDDTATELVLERREVVRRNEPLEALVLRELIKGPGIQGAVATIPPETKVISVQVVERVAFVNFSKELASRHPGGSAGELMTISSIVFSLTELPGIEKVQLLLEGEKQESIFGHSITIEPIGRDSLQPFQGSGVSILDVTTTWDSESQALAGPVTAVAVGNFAGSGQDIVAAAGGMLYLFAYDDDVYSLVGQMSFDRYVTGLAAADFTGDGHHYILAAGAASGNWNPNVPGFLSILDYSDGHMFTVAEISKEGMPFWSVAAMNIEGIARPEILVSNGNGLYVFAVDDSFGLRQLHLLGRFSGTIAATEDVLVWRDSNGTRLGMFKWQGSDWEQLWLTGSTGEWLEGTPAPGRIFSTGEAVVLIGNMSGSLTAFSLEGEPVDLPEELQQRASPLISRTSPVISPYGDVIFGADNKVVRWR